MSPFCSLVNSIVLLPFCSEYEKLDYEKLDSSDFHFGDGKANYLFLSFDKTVGSGIHHTLYFNSIVINVHF